MIRDALAFAVLLATVYVLVAWMTSAYFATGDGEKIQFRKGWEELIERYIPTSSG